MISNAIVSSYFYAMQCLDLHNLCERAVPWFIEVFNQS